MQDTFKISMLLDFYGKLITARQYEIISMYFNEDYSLGEIAERLNISRQGVYDNIRRGSTILNDFENKLGLVEKNGISKTVFGNIEKEVDEILSKTDDMSIKKKLKRIKGELMKVME
jgi:hypothetical protein